jgi:flagella basal body P-ring formation protein FlgA
MIAPKRLLALWVVCLLIALPLVASAAYEPHDNILQMATQFMEARARQVHDPQFDIAVTPGRLDSRLRLRTCDEGLEAFLAPGSRLAGNSTVGVRCHGPVNWSLYVPVQIAVQGDVLVLTQALPRGTLLESSYFRQERYDISQLPRGYFTDVQAAEHMVLRRPLQAGTVLAPSMVEPPRLVQRGQRVVLVAETDTVSVRMEGEALSHGVRGDRVRVRNLSSRRIVEGVVLSHGVVGVSM